MTTDLQPYEQKIVDTLIVAKEHYKTHGRCMDLTGDNCSYYNSATSNMCFVGLALGEDLAYRLAEVIDERNLIDSSAIVSLLDYPSYAEPPLPEEMEQEIRGSLCLPSAVFPSDEDPISQDREAVRAWRGFQHLHDSAWPTTTFDCLDQRGLALAKLAGFNRADRLVPIKVGD